MDKELIIERRGPVAVLTLNRPKRLNAISVGLLKSLSEAVDSIATDYSCRVLIITGAGRAFCAGTDLKEIASGEQRWPSGLGRVQGHVRLGSELNSLIFRLRRIPQPVIAAVNGIAAGGGFCLCLAADFRIVESTAQFKAAFVTIGASAGEMGASFFLPRLVGWEAANDILYTGRLLDAKEAVRIGLAGRAVAAGESVPAAITLAEQICANSPFGTRMSKTLINLSMDSASLEQTLEIENRTQILCSETADFSEGVRSFVERRPPAYSDQ